MPADIAPSPITAMTLRLPPCRSRGHRHAEPGRDRGGGMRRAERVVFAFGAPGEAGKPALLAQRADAVAPAGQDLVRIGLVADIPDQPVVAACRRRDAARPSVRPRQGPAPRCPPVCETASIISARSSAGELRQVRFRAVCGDRPGRGPCREAVFEASNSRVRSAVYRAFDLHWEYRRLTAVVNARQCHVSFRAAE